MISLAAFLRPSLLLQWLHTLGQMVAKLSAYPASLLSKCSHQKFAHVGLLSGCQHLI